MENKEEFKKPATELKFFISFFFIFISLYFLYDLSLEEVEAMPKGESSYWVYIMNLAVWTIFKLQPCTIIMKKYYLNYLKYLTRRYPLIIL